MNLRHLRTNDGLRERLAAEYVLGTLRGGARRRFERWLRDDALLRHSVAHWQDRLHPMAEFAPPARPSPRVWQTIEQRLGLHYRARSVSSSLRAGWLQSLAFWRSLGVGATAVAAVLVAVMLTREPVSVVAPRPNSVATYGPTYVATLTDDKARPAVVITGDAQHQVLVVKVVAPPALRADQSLELWALPRDGAPRSLGLLAADGTVTLQLPAQVTPQDVPTLAVSVEPKGGSPNPAGPTGPVLYTGAWLQV